MHMQRLQGNHYVMHASAPVRKSVSLVKLQNCHLVLGPGQLSVVINVKDAESGLHFFVTLQDRIEVQKKLVTPFRVPENHEYRPREAGLPHERM